MALQMSAALLSHAGGWNMAVYTFAPSVQIGGGSSSWWLQTNSGKKICCIVAVLETKTAIPGIGAAVRLRSERGATSVCTVGRGFHFTLWLAGDDSLYIAG
jgi:hypothetical protein